MQKPQRDTFYVIAVRYPKHKATIVPHYDPQAWILEPRGQDGNLSELIQVSAKPVPVI